MFRTLTSTRSGVTLRLPAPSRPRRGLDSGDTDGTTQQVGRHSRRAPWQLGREPLLLSLIVLVVAGLSVVTVRTLAAAPPDPVVGCTGPTTMLSVGRRCGSVT